MKTPPDPASAPPPETPIPDNVRKRLLTEAERLWADLQANELGGYSGINRPFWIQHIFKEVWRDGWNAALAAQPPASQKPVIITRMLDGTLAPPPQPGDAERLERIRRRLRYRQFMEQFSYEDVATLQRTLDAAQSALAESQKRIATLERVNKRRKELYESAEAELAAEKRDHELTCKMHSVTISKYEELQSALAAARAQGVRDGIEMAALLASEAETVCDLFGGDKSVDALRAALSAYLDATQGVK